MDDRCLAFVLSGGGARGAMQVGALRALLEAGFKPDLLVGTSIGAINATCLAMWGVDLSSIDRMEQSYQEMVDTNVMDPRLGRVGLRALAGQPNHQATRRVEAFLISKGITPDFRFDQIAHAQLALVGADLTTGQPVIYGQDPDQPVLDGILVSIALHPWFAAVEKDGHFLVDGGALSNLPVEAALRMGATEIIGLDLNDLELLGGNNAGIGQYLDRLVFSVIQRQADLEIALAEAQGVTVHTIELRSSPPASIWDFSTCQELFHVGYEIAAREISDWDRVDSAQPEPMMTHRSLETRP